MKFFLATFVMSAICYSTTMATTPTSKHWNKETSTKTLRQEVDSNVVNVHHLRIKLNSSYDHFIQNINKVLNKLEPNWSANISQNPAVVQQHLQKVAGSAGLMIFGQQEHGKLLIIKGHPRKALQYLIGNPLTAAEMTQYDIRAGLYAPLRVLVYEDDDKTAYVEYDKPSDLFGQFGNDKILAISQKLDHSILNAILLADKD